MRAAQGGLHLLSHSSSHLNGVPAGDWGALSAAACSGASAGRASPSASGCPRWRRWRLVSRSASDTLEKGKSWGRTGGVRRMNRRAGLSLRGRPGESPSCRTINGAIAAAERVHIKDHRHRLAETAVGGWPHPPCALLQTARDEPAGREALGGALGGQRVFWGSDGWGVGGGGGAGGGGGTGGPGGFSKDAGLPSCDQQPAKIHPTGLSLRFAQGLEQPAGLRCAGPLPGDPYPRAPWK